jgi:hypothetical protein
VIFASLNQRCSISSEEIEGFYWAHGMLELQHFLLCRPNGPRDAGWRFAILDADTECRVGFARENPGRVASFLGRFVSSRILPGRVEVRETGDEPLVFVVTSPPPLFGSQIDISDADDHPVGHVRLGPRSGGETGRILDRGNSLFAKLRGEWNSRSIVIAQPDGSELATVRKEPSISSGRQEQADSCLFLRVNDLAADDPFAKMLLLGSVLALDLVHR